MGRGAPESDRRQTHIYTYRLRSIARRRGLDYIVLALVIGVIGGVAMGSATIGRRTQSSFSAYLRHDNASTLTMSAYGVVTGSAASNYSPHVENEIRHLPEVETVEAWGGTFAVPVQPDGVPEAAANNAVNVAVSIDGLFFDQDRASVVRGRMADPNSPFEFVTSESGARALDLQVGQTVTFGLFGLSQVDSPGFGTPAVQPTRRLQMRLVGLVEFNDEVIEDDTDQYPTNLVLTPAFSRLFPILNNGTWYGIRLQPGVSDMGRIEQRLENLLPPGTSANFNLVSTVRSKVESSLRPESIALGVFGLIALLAAIGIGLPIIARITLDGEGDRSVLRALGAPEGAIATDTYAGLLAAVVIGCVLASTFAVLLSELGPLGPVRRVFHPGSITTDWTVLGAGVVVLLLALGAPSVLIARRQARTAGRRTSTVAGPRSRLAEVAASAGAPPPVLVGVRFALESGSGRAVNSSRSVIIGAVVSVTLVVATVTFGSGLRTLVSRPSLYGWNWGYALTSGTDVPPAALAALSDDPDVEAWSGYTEVNLDVDGQIVPVLGANESLSVTPPLLSGRSIDGPGQILLGDASLAGLHKHVGDYVEIGYGSPSTAPLYLPPQRMRVVGTATLPAIAGSNTFSVHTSMGVGGVMSYSRLPASFGKQTESPDPTQ
ncbi:MAG TPA: ABC transporter permease, partial [Acidimicrobiales bacterium]|nr:ABC transporter permease [Acidimicrobiales bacterium]